jgi:hypothetical protein
MNTTISQPRVFDPLKKITLATVKKFVRENKGELFINVKSAFSGMTDGCEYRNNGFELAKPTTDHIDHTLGISGAWLVGSSRNYFTPYNDGELTGITVSNSCGHFVLAITVAR